MKTKKLIAIVVLAALGLSAQAQIVSSRSDQVIVTQQVKEKKPKKPKKPRTFNWNLRLGYSLDNMTGGEGLSMTSGFDASFGISKSIGNNGLFWGVEAGVMSYGAYLKEGDRSASCVGIALSPRIGMSFPFTGDMTLNIYGGPCIGNRFGDKFFWWGPGSRQELVITERFDAGVNVGAELLVSKSFFFDLHVKKGFTKAGEIWGDQYRERVSSLKIVAGIGFQF